LETSSKNKRNNFFPSINQIKLFILEHGIYVFLVLLILLSSILSPTFFKLDNILNMLRSAAVLGIVSIGQTYVIIGGGADLSVGATMGTVAIMISEITKGENNNVAVGILACLLVGVIIGLINGLLITKRNMPPLVVSLGMAILVEGTRLAYTQGIISGRPAPFIRELAKIHGIFPVPLLIMVVFFAIASIILNHSPFGRKLFAVGGNPEAAKYSGIKVDKTVIISYMISGFFAALAGLVLSGYIGYGDRYLGTGFNMDSVAATIVGGTSFEGGKGGIGGTIVGVAIMTILFNITLMLGLPINVQLIVKGLIIIAAVLMYSIMQTSAMGSNITGASSLLSIIKPKKKIRKERK